MTEVYMLMNSKPSEVQLNLVIVDAEGDLQQQPALGLCSIRVPKQEKATMFLLIRPDSLPLSDCVTTDVTDNYPTILQKYTSCRWRLSYMLCMAFMLSFILRNSMSFAIVCMTGTVYQTKGENLQMQQQQNISSTFNSSNFETEYQGEFNYTSEEQGLLISSSFYAAIISPMIGSYLSRNFGPKKIILLFMVISCAVTFVIPICARTHLYLVLACRIVVGFAVNAILPVSFDMWMFWAPAQEKEQLVSYAFVGYSFALILQYMVSGFICLVPVDNGWPFIFYVFGSIGLLWSVIWYLSVYESPEDHPRISEREKAFIIANRNITVQKAKIIPWKNIVRSKPVWAYCILFFCHDWNSSILFSFLPLYMATVLKFDVTQNGLLSSLPYISRVIATFFWGYVAVRLTRIMPVTTTRKLMQCTGFAVAAGLSVALCYVQEGQEYVAVGLFIISTPFHAVSVCSGVITPVDMAPQYASAITSLGMIPTFMGMMISPIFVSHIITERTRQQWSIVFYSLAGFFIFAATVFLLFGSGDLQSWARNPIETETEIAGRTRERKSADNDA